MESARYIRIQNLIKNIPDLTDGQIYWIERVVAVFRSPFIYKVVDGIFVDETILRDFGDALRIHHSFSAEPFTKDKFEFVLEKVLNITGHSATLAPKGHRGHDITIDGTTFSLKTQADKGIKEDRIWISKFMELGKGKWGDDPNDLNQYLAAFLEHLNKYERIFVLRALEKGPEWFYELVEIPKDILMRAENGELVMMTDSRQYPKPGYCYVKNSKNVEIFQLYFDAGGERKLQVKNLQKKYCIIHATWKFLIPEK